MVRVKTENDVAKEEFRGKGEAASRLKPEAGSLKMRASHIKPSNLTYKKGGKAKGGKSK